jgi:multiple sugar transport system permease protein
MATVTGGPAQVSPALSPATARSRGRFRRSRGEPYKREEVIMAYLFILIPMAIFMVFFFGAMGFDFWISFNHWAILDSPRFVGSANYNYVFRVDPLFWTAIGNTFEYAVVVVPIQTVIAFMLALTVNQNIRGKAIYRTLYFLPVVTMPAAIGSRTQTRQRSRR